MKRRRFQWNEEVMALAVEAVKSGRCTVYAASGNGPGSFGVPYGTLGRLVGGEVSMGARPGPQSVLGNDLEARLEHYMISMSELTVRPGVFKIRTTYVFVFAPKEVQCP